MPCITERPIFGYTGISPQSRFIHPGRVPPFWALRRKKRNLDQFVPNCIGTGNTTTRDCPLPSSAKPHSSFFPRSVPKGPQILSPLWNPNRKSPTSPTMEDDKAAKVKKKGTVHRKSLSCEYCSRSFARLEHLQRHLRTR